MSEALKRKAQHLRDRAFELLDAATALENRPEEPNQDGLAVIYFSKRYNGNQAYEYAAFRTTNEGDTARWFRTGTRGNPGPYTWSDLLDFIYSGEDPTALPEILIASAFDTL